MEDNVCLRAEIGHPNRCYAWMGEMSLNVSALTRTLLSPGQTFLDIGAFTGQHSIRASHLVGESGKVIAYEPDPRVVSHLQKNIANSGATVEVRPRVVSTSSGLVSFNLHSSISMSSINAIAEQSKESTLSLEADSITEIVESVRPDVVKIDVEGADADLVSAISKMQSHPANVIVEDNDGVRDALSTNGWWWINTDSLDMRWEQFANTSADIWAAPQPPANFDELRKTYSVNVRKLSKLPTVAYE